MMGKLLRTLELLFFVYFAIHIPITVLLDSQAIFPVKYYPNQVIHLTKWYVSELKDTYFGRPPIWYRSFVVVELVLQLPFFPVAAYAFLKGRCAWIRIPSIIYSAHVCTTVLPMLASFLYDDFTKHNPVGPSTLNERITLVSIYAPYFIIPLLILCTMLLSSDYTKQNISVNTSNSKLNRQKNK